MNKEQIKIKDLPSPKGAFLVGHLPQFNADNKHQVLERWVEECGDLFKINFVGKAFVVSANPTINTEILKLRPEKFRRFSKIDEILKEMGVVGVFNAEGDTWKRHRKITAEALNAKKVRENYDVIVNKTNRLLEKFKGYSQNNKQIDIQKELMAFTIDVTTAIAFGYELDTINNKADSFQQHLECIFPMINERITAPLPIWRVIKRKKDKELEQSIAAIEKIIYQFIEEARVRLDRNPELTSNPTNFLEALLSDDNDVDFTNEEIYGNIFTMLLAGEDTTSNSISWAIYFLSQNPKIVNKVREEANAVYGNFEVPQTNKELLKLKYTNAVVQEAIRLKPTTPQLYMEALESLIVENLFIPKHTKIILQTKVAQTKEMYFSNPNDFSPERWLKSECPMHQNHSPEMIKAFGGGPRFCPGMKLAINEMVILLSVLCKHFDFKMTVKPEDVKEQFSFTMYPENLFIQLSSID